MLVVDVLAAAVLDDYWRSLEIVLYLIQLYLSRFDSLGF